MFRNQERREKTAALKVHRQSDFDRWSDQTSLLESWDERTEELVQFIQPNSSVFEFGAGKGVLKKILPENCSYTKSDLVPHDEDTVVIDLNSDRIKFAGFFDYAVLSGVIEYVYDIDRLSQYLSEQFLNVICSYATREANPLHRRDHGWVNDFSKSQIIDFFDLVGFECVKSAAWKTQDIFHFRKKEKNSNKNLDFIDWTYVISRYVAKDRKAHIRAEFLSLGLQRYHFSTAREASDSEVLELAISQKVKKPDTCFRCGKDICKCSNNVLIPKQIANWMSFLDVFHAVIAKEQSVAMVCEDDVKFTFYANKVFSYLSSSKEICDILNGEKPALIRLGFPGYSPSKHLFLNDISLTQSQTMSNSCFLFNLAYAKYIIDEIEKDDSICHTSDVYFHVLSAGSDVVQRTVVPPPCFDLSQSRLVYSDIHPKDVDEADKKRNRSHVKKLIKSVGFSHVFGGNFGDLIGPYIYNKLTGIKPNLVHINNEEVKNNLTQDHVLCVGSILKHVTENATIWGVGIMDPQDAKSVKQSIDPEKVYAVRGPRTYNALIDEGVMLGDDTVFGDPGLLLPLFYPARNDKKYTFGIVPHFTEYEEVKRRYSQHPDTIVICFGNHESYESIEKTLDLLTSCESILSSSLHGLVVAHAYGIKAAWCNFSPTTKEGKFGTNPLKYIDYLESVECRLTGPVDCISENVVFPKKGSFFLPESEVVTSVQVELLKSCPFNVYSFDVDDLRNGAFERIGQTLTHSIASLGHR